MAEITYKCDGADGRCGKEFKPGNWECFPGMKHRVAPKTYYMADAPHCNFDKDPDGMAFRSSRTYLHAVPERQFRDDNGIVRTSAYPPAVFVMGRYETSDPEFQFHMEHGAARNSLCSYERWFEAYHTPKQKQNIADGKIRQRTAELEARAAEVERKEREYNDLLEKVKASKASK